MKIGRVIATGLVFFVMPLWAADPATSSPAPVARVVWVKGDALSAFMPNKTARSLKRTSPIFLNDTLKIGVGTRAEIVFTDNTLMTFKPDTTFIINEYVYKKPQPGGEVSTGKYVMKLIEGGFRTITGFIAKEHPDDYRVNTPVATIGVRGTDYAAFYNQKMKMYVAYYSGSPCVSAIGGAVKTCLNEKMRYVRVPKAGAAPEPVSGLPKEFSDKIEVTPMKYARMEQSAASQMTEGQEGQRTRNQSGTVSSFCIK